MPPKVKEQCTNVITMTIVEVNNTGKNCTKILEESLEVLTTLQEDLNIQRLEIEASELLQKYDEIKGTIQMVSLTQRLTRMQQAKALKEKVDAARHKEVVLKACIQPWIDEAFIIIAFIEANIT